MQNFQDAFETRSYVNDHLPVLFFNFLKGCLPQNLLSPLLNTLSHR